nr:unnamed protein product [Digitaria exilis]
MLLLLQINRTAPQVLVSGLDGDIGGCLTSIVLDSGQTSIVSSVGRRHRDPASTLDYRSRGLGTLDERSLDGSSWTAA